MEIEINGVKYTERIVNKKHTANIAAFASILIATSQMCFAQSQSLKGSPPEVNIILEFELIQKKKSKLSKSEREYVVRTFNKRFKAIEQ